MADKKTTSYPKEKINILFLENISDAAVKHFKDSGYVSVRKVAGALSEEQLIKEIKDVHLLGIRSKTQITQNVLEAAKKLQAIGCFCIGVNQVDLKAATKNGIVVFNAPYSNTRSVAELVIGASIMLIRRIPDKNKAAHEGIWLKESKGSYELRGKTLGIVGYGNIGSQVSVMAEALGMNVLFHDVIPKLPHGNARPARNLQDLLGKSDIVTLHVPGGASTRGMINADTLAHARPGSVLINYSRGDVVDLDALKSCAERSGDPFETVLQNLPNVILTPHIGGSTEEAQADIGLDVSSKLVQYLEFGTSSGSHTVPPVSL